VSDDLIAFVRACLDREERVALAAAEQDPAPWANKVDAEPGGYTSGRITDANGYTVVHVEDQTPGFATAEHIALHDPASVLARVASDRAILERYDSLLRSPAVDSVGIAISHARVFEYETRVIPAMARRYAGWDGWQEAWRA